VTAVDSLFEQLNAITEVERITAGAPARLAGLEPSIRILPSTIEQAAACLMVATDQGAVVVPSGGGTQQRIGNLPERCDIELCTLRLNRTVEWEPADLTACFEAGVTLEGAQRELAGAGQQLAIDAPVPDKATLGGLIATNVSGPRRWIYGSWSDQVIGMRMALTCGDVIKSGGRVVKNVQGYDLAKLFTGSLGTLGLIGEINVKLIPLPPYRRLLVASGGSANVERLIADLMNSALRVSTLDLLDAVSAKRVGVDRGAEASAFLLIEGSQAVVGGQSRRLAQLAGEQGLDLEAIEGDLLEEVWTKWVDLDRIDDLGARDVLITVVVQPSEVLEAISMVQRVTEAAELMSEIWARAGNGIISARLSSTQPQESEILGQMQAKLIERWPNTRIVCGDPRLTKGLRVWGEEPAGLSQMRDLKRRFDPARTLQPGRFVGGI
jgi:glycolate dehydrogenase FAD-binding subunit